MSRRKLLNLAVTFSSFLLMGLTVWRFVITPPQQIFGTYESCMTACRAHYYYYEPTGYLNEEICDTACNSVSPEACSAYIESELDWGYDWTEVNYDGDTAPCAEIEVEEEESYEYSTLSLEGLDAGCYIACADNNTEDPTACYDVCMEEDGIACSDLVSSEGYFEISLNNGMTWTTICNSYSYTDLSVNENCYDNFLYDFEDESEAAYTCYVDNYDSCIDNMLNWSSLGIFYCIDAFHEVKDLSCSSTCITDCLDGGDDIGECSYNCSDDMDYCMSQEDDFEFCQEDVGTDCDYDSDCFDSCSLQEESSVCYAMCSAPNSSHCLNYCLDWELEDCSLICDYDAEVGEHYLADGSGGDTIAPEITIDNEQDVILGDAIRIYGNSYDESSNVASVEYKQDGWWNDCEAVDESFDSSDEDFYCDVSGLSVGSHTIELRSDDIAENSSAFEDYGSFSFDTVAFPDNKLIAHWSLDSTTNFDDELGYFSYGTLGGGTLTSIEADHSDTALVFSNGARINYPDYNSGLGFSNDGDQFSVEAWVKADFEGGNYYTRVVGKYNEDNNENTWMMGIDNAGEFGEEAGIYCSFWTEDGGMESIERNKNIINNEWNHIACVWDAENDKIEAYVNYELAESKDIGSDKVLKASNNYFTIGARPDGGSAFNGQIDEIKIYNTALDYSNLVPTISIVNAAEVISNLDDISLTGTLFNYGSTIDGIEYREYEIGLGDDDNWQSCSCDDGSCDEASEDFTCSFSASNASLKKYQLRAFEGEENYSDIVFFETSYDPAGDLLSWWNFNESDMIDWGSDFDMSLNGSAVLGTGDDLGALDLSDYYYSYDDSAGDFDFDTETSELRIDVRFKVASDFTGWKHLASKENSEGNLTWNLSINDENKLVFEVHGENGDDRITATEAITADEWHDVTLLFNAADRAYSLTDNGVTINAVSTYKDYPQDSSQNLVLGARGAGNEIFDGLIDDLRIYDEADALAPTIEITPLENPERVTTDSPSISATITDPSGVKEVEYLLYDFFWTSEDIEGLNWQNIETPDDGVFDETTEEVTINFSDLEDDNWYLFIRATDENGNKSLGGRSGYIHYYHTYSTGITGTYRFVVEADDETPPQIHANSIMPDPTTDRNPMVHGYVQDYHIEGTGDTASNIAQIYYRIDGGLWQAVDALDESYDSSFEEFSFNLNYLDPGTYTLEIKALDAAGNTTASEEVGSTNGNYLEEFTIVNPPETVQETLVEKEEDFESHEYHDLLFTDAVWGNGIVRLTQEIDLELENVLYTNEEEFGSVNGSVNIDLFNATDGNIWMELNSNIFAYFNTETESLTRYPQLGERGDKIHKIEEFIQDGNRYLFISYDAAADSRIYDINNTPEDTSDDGGAAAYVSLADSNLNNDDHEGLHYIGSDIVDGYFVIWGQSQCSGECTDSIVRINTNNTIMNLADDSYVYYGQDEGLAQINYTGTYLDTVNDIVFLSRYQGGLYTCTDNGTLTVADDQCFEATEDSPNNVFSIRPDDDGNLWFAGDLGLAVLDHADTADTSDDQWTTVLSRADLGNERVNELAIAADVFPVGDEMMFTTREGYFKVLENNDTATDLLDDTLFSEKLPNVNNTGFIDPAFLMTDRDTVWFMLAGDGLYKGSLSRDYANSNTVEFLPIPPDGLLAIDSFTLNGVTGSTTSESPFASLMSYEVSNDDGLNWYPIEVGGTVEFPTSDYRLKLRLTLAHGSTPIVDSISMSYEAAPGDVFSQYNVAAASSGSSSDDSSDSSSVPTYCGARSPGGKQPEIYAAVKEGIRSVRLYFTDGDKPISHYALIYGNDSGNYLYGSLDIGKYGQRSYVVDKLKPGEDYYFRVVPMNDCQSGPSSEEFYYHNAWFSLGGAEELEVGTEISGEEAEETGFEVQERISDLGRDVTLNFVDKYGNAVEGLSFVYQGDLYQSDASGKVALGRVKEESLELDINYKDMTTSKSIKLNSDYEILNVDVSLEKVVVKGFFARLIDKIRGWF